MPEEFSQTPEAPAPAAPESTPAAAAPPAEPSTPPARVGSTDAAVAPVSTSTEVPAAPATAPESATSTGSATPGTATAAPQLETPPAAPAAPPSLLERYGGEQMAEPILRIGAAALTSENPVDAWAQIYAESPGRADALLEGAIQAWGPQIVARLQAKGLIPDAASAPAAAASNVHPSELATIPQQFHDAYSALTEEERYHLQNMDEGPRNLMLGRVQKDYEAEQAKVAERAQAAQAAEQAYHQQVKEEGQKFYDGIRGALRQQITSQVKLTGDAATDSFLTEMILDHVENEFDRDPQGYRFIGQAQDLLTKGERNQLRGVGFQIQAQAALKLGPIIQRFASVFDKARKYDEIQRGQAQPRAEISGSGAPGYQPQRGNYLENGQIAPSVLNRLKDDLKARLASGE